MGIALTAAKSASADDEEDRLACTHGELFAALGDDAMARQVYADEDVVAKFLDVRRRKLTHPGEIGHEDANVFNGPAHDVDVRRASWKRLHGQRAPLEKAAQGASIFVRG